MSTSKVPQISVGELINVQIRGARVMQVDSPESDPLLSLEAGVYSFEVPAQAPGVTVERVAPAQWPPQIGDIWADRDDREWVAADTDGETIVMWRFGGRDTTDALDVLADHGPMRLVRRRGWTPAADTAPAEPERVDERAAVIAGLRAFADLLESRPDLPGPGPWSDLIWGATREQVDEWARVFGVPVKVSVHTDGATHYTAKAQMGVQVRPYFIDESTKPVATSEPVGGVITRPELALVGELPHRVPDPDAASVLAETLADGVS